MKWVIATRQRLAMPEKNSPVLRSMKSEAIELVDWTGRGRK